MDGGKNCLICFAEYTIDGRHRMISLKCGHLFGAECIERWIGVYKKGYCPTCSAPSRKTHFRPIFAAKAEAADADHEKEMIEKYREEKETRRALEMEISRLKAQIEIMKLSFKQQQHSAPSQGARISRRFVKYCKIHFFPDNSLMCFDPINQALLISCYKNGEFGIFKYSLADFSINSFIKLDEGVRGMEMSPFSDGICMIARGSRVALFNVYMETIIRDIAFDNPISAVSFSKLERNVIFVADMAGWFYVHNMETMETEKTKICSENIHSIAEAPDAVYLGTVFAVYVYKCKSGTPAVSALAGEGIPGICTRVTAMEKDVLALFRSENGSISCFMMGCRYVAFVPGVRQFAKHNDGLFNGYLLISDDTKNSIKVLNYETQQMEHLYVFKEMVVGFCGDSETLVVLTRRGVYLYASEKR